MVTKTETGEYKCAICGELYDRDTLALSCEQSHDIIYVPMTRMDLYKLLQFIMTRDMTLLSPSLMKTLNQYKRGTYK